MRLSRFSGLPPKGPPTSDDERGIAFRKALDALKEFPCPE
jgi:hypothetical protein